MFTYCGAASQPDCAWAPVAVTTPLQLVTAHRCLFVLKMAGESAHESYLGTCRFAVHERPDGEEEPGEIYVAPVSVVLRIIGQLGSYDSARNRPIPGCSLRRSQSNMPTAW